MCCRDQWFSHWSSVLPKRACLSHTEQGQFQASHPSLWVLFLVGGGVGVARSLFLIPCVVSLGLLNWQLGSVSPPTTRRPQCPWVRPLLLHKCIGFLIVP